MGKMTGRRDLIVAAAAAVLLHGIFLWPFPGDVTPPRLELKADRPVRLTVRLPAPPSPQQAESPRPPATPPVAAPPEPLPVPLKSIKKAVIKKAEPVKEEVKREKPPHEPEAPPREKVSVTPSLESTALARREMQEAAVRSREALDRRDDGEDSGSVREEARYEHNPPPAYPPLARRRGYEGTVLLLVEVLPGGTAGR
ncbi:MAG TPA: hypothetical protein PL090_05285, partial [Syntrophales bacterium]|nr:hypothetical protein [Syntrophales bacterium]